MKIQAQQVAVVTGGGSGIGAALARACARKAMRVVVADIEQAAAETTAEELRQLGAEAIAVQVDVADSESVTALAAATQKAFGTCHLLCNNAGVCINRPTLELTTADWDWVLSVNIMGVVNSLNAFLPDMLNAGQAAHIVNTASVTGLVALGAVGPVYTASKYAVVGLSEVLQQELATTEIGVSILCPGAVSTRILESERNRPGGDPEGGKKETFTESDETYTRMIEPGAVAASVLEAVEGDQLFVVTHPEWFPIYNERNAILKGAFNQ